MLPSGRWGLAGFLLFLAVGTQSAAQAQSSLFATGPDVWVRFAGLTAGYTSDLLWHETVGGPRMVHLFTNQSSTAGAEVKLPHRFARGEEVIFSLFVHETGHTYWSGPGSRNPDGLEHYAVKSLLVDPRYALRGGFEDLFGGGDQDFDDMLFDFGGVTTSTVTPEPGTLALLGTGLAGLTAVRRRRRRPDE